MWRMIGPALLFSGTAIGTSHLFQSTRAGAVYGLALAAVIVFACLLKYPAFRFAVDYGHSTRRSLVAGYRELGLWAPILFATVFLIIPIIFAALSSATAGIAIAVFEVDVSVPILAIALLVGVVIILLAGGYYWLDLINRVLVFFLLLSTLATTALVLSRVEWGTIAEFSWMVDPKALLFVIALAGFMPNALEVSVAQSMWTAEAAQRAETKSPTEIGEARFAFLSGYVLTAVLAICFCIIGAGVMHSSGIAPETNAPGLARQIMGLYRTVFGEAASVLAGIAALSVMLTTLLASVDVAGRNFATTWQEVFAQTEQKTFDSAYKLSTGLLIVSTASVLLLFTDSFTSMLDLATSLAFIVTPMIAFLNHMVVTRCQMPEESRPSHALRTLNIVAIITMAGLAGLFFVL